jgi:hypothetical protein
MNIGIVGARKYQNRGSVINLVNSLPIESVIITSGCKGVCKWVREAAEERNMKVIVYAPDLEDIRARFEIPKRYYQRNKELVEGCDILYAFISKEGYTGGTRFEIEYALKIGIPVQIHWEDGLSQIFYQYLFPFMQPEQIFLLAWEEFFRKTNLEIRGGINHEMCNMWS